MVLTGGGKKNMEIESANVSFDSDGYPFLRLSVRVNGETRDSEMGLEQNRMLERGYAYLPGLGEFFEPVIVEGKAIKDATREPVFVKLAKAFTWACENGTVSVGDWMPVVSLIENRLKEQEEV